MVAHPVQRILGLLRIEDALLVPHRHQVAHDAFVELGMALHRDQLAFLVHALHETSGRPAQCFDPFRVLEDNVSVHLMDALPNPLVHVTERGVRAYQCILLEYLLALCSQFDRQH